MEVQEYLNAIENKDYQRLTFIEDRIYFISKNGEVLSLNSGTPKPILSKRVASGEKVVTLYTPELYAFKVADLILRVFEGEPQPGQVACYKDRNPINLFKDNLYWGVSKGIVDIETSRVINEIRQTHNSQTNSYIVKDNNVVVNPAIKAAVENFLIQLTRITVKETLSEHDTKILDSFIEKISKVVNSNVLALSEYKESIPKNIRHPYVNSLVKEFVSNVDKSLELYNL